MARNFKVQPWQVFKAVYDMCKPVGMGFMQFVPGDMSEDNAKQAVNAHLFGDTHGNVRMDYVHGRQCKFNFKINKDGTCTINDDSWYDHTQAQLQELIATLEKLETP